MKVTKSVTIIFILIHISSCDDCASGYRKFGKPDIINDGIENLYLDNENHMTPTFVLKNSKRVLKLGGLTELYYKAEIGDTLKKDSNSLDFYLIKKDTALIFNPKCNGTYIYN